MTKKDLVKWLQGQKDIALGRVNKDSANSMEKLREKYLKDFGVDKFLDEVIPQLEQVYNSYGKLIDNIMKEEGVSISRYHYKFGYYDFEKLTHKSDFKSAIFSCLHFDNDHEYKKKVRELNDFVHSVERTYDTTIQTIKNLPTAKDGIEYLKKLGFDVSKIEPAEKKKQLPATISVNVDIKYLLLNKEEEEEK